MRRIVLFVVLSIVFFVGVYSLLNGVDWVSLFRIERSGDFVEHELGELMMRQIEQTECVVDDGLLIDFLEDVKDRICESNSISKESISVKLIDSDEVNAFAILGGRIYFTTGILKEMDSAEGVAGVMAHEIAHIERRHLRKKLIRTFGLSVLASSSAGVDALLIKELVSDLSSTAFDRASEKEADFYGISYLKEAEIDPHDLVRFFEGLLSSGGDSSDRFVWLSTHPTAVSRIDDLRREIGRMSQVEFREVVSIEYWESVRLVLDGY